MCLTPREDVQPAAVQCMECRLEADERFTVAEQWSWWIDGQGGLRPFCPVCAEREFGHRTKLTAVG
jgi:hypothetical protein